jgi:sporulation protein YlmC with PRC-barrel domain
MADQNPASMVGSEVYSIVGANVGTVAEVVDQAGQPTFLKVKHNGLFGIGTESFLVPVDAITASEDGKLTVNKSREDLVGIPAHDDDEPAQPGFFDSVYAWWWRGNPQ